MGVNERQQCVVAEARRRHGTDCVIDESPGSSQRRWVALMGDQRIAKGRPFPYKAVCREIRRGAGAVDRGGLENRCTLTGTEGSNPSLSAKSSTQLIEITSEKIIAACHAPIPVPIHKHERRRTVAAIALPVHLVRIVF